MIRNMILEEISNFLEGGTVAFEHGFRHPVIEENGRKYAVSMVRDDYVSVGEVMGRRTKWGSKLPTRELSEKSLRTVYKGMTDYLYYCQHYA
jgi:hypothetical protein